MNRLEERLNADYTTQAITNLHSSEAGVTREAMWLSKECYSARSFQLLPPSALDQV